MRRDWFLYAQVHSGSCSSSCDLFRVFLYMVSAFTAIDALTGITMMVLGERLKRSNRTSTRMCGPMTYFECTTLLGVTCQSAALCSSS